MNDFVLVRSMKGDWFARVELDAESLERIAAAVGETDTELYFRFLEGADEIRDRENQDVS